MTDLLPELIEEVVEAPKMGDQESVASTIAIQAAMDTALLLESLPIAQRLSTWEMVPKVKRLDVLVNMRGDPRETLIDAIELADWDDIFSDIEAEQLLELADSLPNKLVDRALISMDKKQRQYFKDANQYEDEQIGHWLDHELLVLPITAKVRDGLRLIRRGVPFHTDTIFLVNRAGQFTEVVRLDNLYKTPEHVPLVDISEEKIEVLHAEDDCNTAATVVQNSVYMSLPVINESNVLLGRVNIRTACELKNEYYERQVMASAGMDEDEDLFSPVRKSAQNRAVWLGINLLTAFLASWFIGLFEATLQQVVALAVLMPVVASMGGIAGSQTLTLMIRGLALGQVTKSNVISLLKKEMRVGGLNGVVWAIVIGIVAWMWFTDPWLGVVIGLAIMLNIVSAALAGVAVPVVLDKLDIDPALSGSVILTTVTDIVGFVTFLGLGSLFLL